MNYNIERHAEVARDIVDLAEWIARDSREAAFRFTENVEATISSLAQMPRRGSPKRVRYRRLKNLRTWAVDGFPKHLILYQVQADVVQILAIMHGARNYPRLLRKRTNRD